MTLQEIFITLTIGVIGALLGSFISPWVKHIFGKRLILSEKILQHKIKLYEDISEIVMLEWECSRDCIVELRYGSQEDIKNVVTRFKNIHNDYMKNLAKVMVYCNKEINDKVVDILEPFTKTANVILVFMKKEDISKDDKEKYFQEITNLLGVSQGNITQLANLFREDLNVNKIDFRDRLF